MTLGRYPGEFGDGVLQGIVEVMNTGTAWAKLSGDLSYTLYAKDGSVVGTGELKPAPQFLAPGAAGYLLAWDSLSNGNLQAIAKLDPTVSFVTVSEADVPDPASFVVDKVRITGDDLGVWTDASGTLANKTGDDASFVQVYIVVLDKSKHAFGFLSHTESSLAAGKMKGFKDESAFLPASQASRIEYYQAIAYASQY